MPRAAFEHVPDLAELHLSGNPLKTLADDAFPRFRHLVSLDLGSCMVKRVAESAFRGLGTLRTLKLADNNLSFVPSDAFRHTPALENLDLGRNPFVVLAKNDFRRLRKLKKVSIVGCGRLRVVEKEAFANCVDLEHVSIAENRRLDTVESEAFDVTPNLKHLDLSDNALATLSEGFASLSSVATLKLGGNPWRCDCDLSFLVHMAGAILESSRKAAMEDNAVSSEGLLAASVSPGKCAEPPSLRKTKLTDVSLDDVECDDEAANRVRHEPQESIESGAKDAQKGQGFFSASTVIIISAVAASLLLLSLLALLTVRYGDRARAWAKAWQARRGAGSALSAAVHSSSSSTASSRLHHPQHHDPYLTSRQHEYRKPSYSCDDEHYYYVATLQNRLAAGKHIPVTEL